MQQLRLVQQSYVSVVGRRGLRSYGSSSYATVNSNVEAEESSEEVQGLASSGGVLDADSITRKKHMENTVGQSHLFSKREVSQLADQNKDIALGIFRSSYHKPLLLKFQEHYQQHLNKVREVKHQRNLALKEWYKQVRYEKGAIKRYDATAKHEILVQKALDDNYVKMYTEMTDASLEKLNKDLEAEADAWIENSPGQDSDINPILYDDSKSLEDIPEDEDLAPGLAPSYDDPSEPSAEAKANSERLMQAFSGEYGLEQKDYTLEELEAELGLKKSDLSKLKPQEIKDIEKRMGITYANPTKVSDLEVNEDDDDILFPDDPTNEEVLENTDHEFREKGLNLSDAELRRFISLNMEKAGLTFEDFKAEDIPELKEGEALVDINGRNDRVEAIKNYFSTVPQEKFSSPEVLQEYIGQYLNIAGTTDAKIIHKLSQMIVSKASPTQSYLAALVLDDLSQPLKPDSENTLVLSTAKWYPEQGSMHIFKDRKAKLSVQVGDLGLPEEARKRLIQIAHYRYKRSTDTLIITSTRLPTKAENKFAVKKQFQYLLHEALLASKNYIPLRAPPTINLFDTTIFQKPAADQPFTFFQLSNDLYN